MATTSYNTISFDLATKVTGSNPAKILQTDGKVVTAVSVMECPVGAAVYLRIGGADADPILLTVNRNMKMCPGERDGIFLDNPIAGLGTLRLVLSYQGSGPENANLEVETR